MFNINNINLNLLPYSKSSFESIRETRKIYVDKTNLISQIASQDIPIFFSRPRRFGKSLLINTLSSLFGNGLKYFHGLDIEKIWTDQTYHVVHLDFSAMADDNPDNFKKKLVDELIDEFHMQGIINIDNSYDIYEPNSILNKICKKLNNNSIVLLIDEYDAPITHHMNNQEELKEIMSILNNFYAVVKKYSGKFRFIFITGITRISHVSIFSAFNNIADLSFENDFDHLLGFTQDDLERYFDDYVHNASIILNMNKDDVYRRLEQYYDGYKFSFESTNTVYNPWSIISFLKFSHNGFKNYWFHSGVTASILINYLKIKEDFDFIVDDKDDMLIDYDFLSGKYEITNIPFNILLYQSGYYTIKIIDYGIASLILANKEVEDSLYKLYLMANDLNPKDKLKMNMSKLSSAINTKDIFTVIEIFNQILNQCVSSSSKIFKDERSLRDIIYAALTYIPSLRIIKERDTAKGRSDLEIYTKKTHLIIEFKRTYPETRSATAALKLAINQIEQNRYGILFFPHYKLVRVAMVISTEKKMILQDYWKEIL